MKDRKNGARYGKGDNSMTRIPVAVLGATGMVGQRFIELLQGHPWFELVGLAASEQRAGRPYKDVAQWRLAGSDMPAEVANLPVIACKPEALPKEVKIVFSALPGEIAGEIEADFARAATHSRGQRRSRGGHSGAAQAARLGRQHRNQRELLGNAPGHGPQTTATGLRCAQGAGDNAASYLWRRLSGTPIL